MTLQLVELGQPKSEYCNTAAENTKLVISMSHICVIHWCHFGKALKGIIHANAHNITNSTAVKASRHRLKVLQ